MTLEDLIAGEMAAGNMPAGEMLAVKCPLVK